MKRPVFLWLLLAGLLAVVPAAGAQTAAPIPPRPEIPNDESEYRRFILDNGMKVILLSDPKLNTASASVSVGVGSLSDPDARQGMAHFLEHMLFLGTEKYPSEDDFDGYLRSNGGYHNAYTAGDHTNYHFQIRPEAFEGALDRFSQFFIAPLFAPEFAEREMNAVNSEFQRHLENDARREYQVTRSLVKPDHPENHFGIGNRETLAGTTREELLEFYRSEYSANRMTLALTGTASLDELERWAREYFSPVVNRELPPVRFPADYLERKAALRLVKIEPVQDVSDLDLEFPLPPTAQHWEGKSTQLLGFILGYEGEGSLLSQLKAEGLATGLGAGAADTAGSYGSFRIGVTLTPKGVAEYDRVLALIFAAIEDLRESPYPSYLFQERQAMARLDEAYQDKGEGTARAIYLANQIREYPLEIAERVPYLWLEEDPETYFLVLDHLRPDNMIVALLTKGVETDTTEPYFGTAYSYNEASRATYTQLLNPPDVAAIHLPKPNPFIPEEADLLPLQPVRLIDEPALSLFFLPDTEFERPLVAEIYRARLPRSLASLETATLLGFYEACVREALNETLYTAAEAGLNVSISAALEGVQLSLSGYDDSSGALLETVVAGLIDFELSADRFAAIKDRIVRDLANFALSEAYQIQLQTRRSVVREFYFRPDEQLAVARDVTLAQVRTFARKLFQRGKLEALIHGNVTPVAARAHARQVANALDLRPVKPDQVLRRRLLVQESGSDLLFTEKLAGSNSGFRREYLLGGDAPEVRAATMVLSNLIAQPFYSEMRTRQQLGYIVGGGAGSEERTNFVYFVIQSGEYPADELTARADSFISQIPGMLDAMPAEQWDMIVAGVRAELEEKDKTIAERAGRLFELAYDYDTEWNRRQETLAALDDLTRERVQEILSRAFDPETRAMRTFLAFSRNHEAGEEMPAAITDPRRWRERQQYQ